jgi:predicted nucleotidyltransferase
VRREYPGLVGIQVHGSVARGEPGPFSDIDMVCVVGRGKKPSEFSFFDGEIYVGVGFLSVDHLEKEFEDPKAFFWARGSANATTVMYDPNRILRRILAKWKGRKPSHQLLEKSLWDDYHNIIEYSGKLRNGWLRRDDYLLRYSAMIIAQHVERVLIALNDLSIISENYLWDQILRVKKKPKHLKADYPVARGLKATRQTQAVYRSALRLCRETLRLIREEFVDEARHPRFRALLTEPLDEFAKPRIDEVWALRKDREASEPLSRPL